MLVGDPGVRRVVCAHGSGFPLTDATSHQLWAVGFPDIVPLHKEVEHPHVPSIVIHFKLSVLESREQARTDVPAPLKREPVAIRDAIPMMGRLAIDSLHEQQFQIIGRSQILWYPTLGHRLVPQHRAPLPPQRVPRLLVIVDDGLDEIALQLFERHAACFRCGCGIMHAVAGIGQTAFKALGHPAKERFDGAFRGWGVRRGLLRNDPEAIHEDLARALGGENLAAVMEDDGGFANTWPGMLASCPHDLGLFRLQGHLHQAHIILLLQGT